MQRTHLRSKARSIVTRTDGVTSVEYLTLVALIGLSTIGAIAALGAGATDIFAGSDSAVGATVVRSDGRGEESGARSAAGALTSGIDSSGGFGASAITGGIESSGGFGTSTDTAAPGDPTRAASALLDDFESASGGDEHISRSDLERIASDASAEAATRDAARYLLEHDDVRDAFDLGARRGEVDDRISRDDLRRTLEDDWTDPSATAERIAAEAEESEDCGFFSVCGLKKAASGVGDFAVGVGTGVVNAVKGFEPIVGWAGRMITGDAETWRATGSAIANGAHALVTDPIGSAKTVGRVAVAIGEHYVNLAKACTTDFSARGCGEAVGEIGFDVALGALTGGAGAAAGRVGRVASFAARHVDEASLAGRTVVGALRGVETGLRIVDAPHRALRAGLRSGRRAITGRALVYADELAPPVRSALTDALARGGVHVRNPRELTRLLNSADGLTDGAVGRLRREVLTDPAHADEVAEALRGYQIGDGAVGAGQEAARVQYYAMAVPESIRPRLMNAIRDDLSNAAIPAASHLATHPTRFRRIVVGGGSQGQTVANRLHDLGHGESTLIVDSAFGDANFGAVRRFDLNSGGQRFDIPGGTELKPVMSPLHGSPIQVGDLDTRQFPNAGAFGDASLIGLHNAWRRGTDVLAETRVLDVFERGADDVWPARYRVDLVRPDGQQLSVYSDDVVLATGLGKSRLVDEPATRALLEADRTLLATRPGDLADARAVTATDLLEAGARNGDTRPFYEGAERVAFIGGGDSASVAVEDFGRAFLNGGPRPEALWFGVDREALWFRYSYARDLLDDGTISSASGRLQRIEQTADGRLRLVTQAKDGTLSSTEVDKVVMAIGVDPDHPRLVTNLAPDFDPKTNIRPLPGVDPHMPDQYLAGRIVNGDEAHDVYVVGVASNIHGLPNAAPVARGPGSYSFLDYYGWKTRHFTDQVLARGPPEQSPLSFLRGE